MITLTELGYIHNTDKATLHSFTDFYDKHFTPIREKQNSILEIGIYLGGSIRMLKDYFPKSIIHAVDIENKSILNEDRIKTYIADQSSHEQLSNHFKGMRFDLIIDDGGHTMQQQQSSFTYLWNNLKSKGMYVMEDLHTSVLFGYYGYNKAGETTLDMVNALQDDKPFTSDFIDAQTFNIIKSQVGKVEIFSKKNGHEFGVSITSVIYKK